MKNNAAAFMRENGPLESFKHIRPHPYYLVFHNGEWIIQDSKSFNDNITTGWVKIKTEGKGLSKTIFYHSVTINLFLETDYLSLDENWEGAPAHEDEVEWLKATVKIFVNENEFKNVK